MSNNSIVGVVAGLILIVGGLVGYVGYKAGSGYTPEPGANVTGQIHRQLEQFTQGVVLGPNGGTIGEMRAVQCDLIANVSITASTSAPVDCAVTGVASGDAVFAQLSTTSQNATNRQWLITSAKASSTAGYVTVMLWNGTGANAVPSATAVGSSTNVQYVDY